MDRDNTSHEMSLSRMHRLKAKNLARYYKHTEPQVPK